MKKYTILLLLLSLLILSGCKDMEKEKEEKQQQYILECNQYTKYLSGYEVIRTDYYGKVPDVCVFIRDGIEKRYWQIIESPEDRCLRNTRSLFEDLNDTRGSTQNNSDSVSRSMLEFYEKCLSHKE